jgi:hypothetical protein
MFVKTPRGEFTNLWRTTISAESKIKQSAKPTPQGRTAGKRVGVLISPLFSQATRTVYSPHIFAYMGKTSRGSHGCF